MYVYIYVYIYIEIYIDIYIYIYYTKCKKFYNTFDVAFSSLLL